ncbi:hypothetical protein PVAR5_0721 [Paecilomyces variotii No. 5]|uniref:Uncharacterized protein n=1 Tax=Byssochlamys spectabilis (strain No. 5 / NBRC 109023) TaxID=1356009 RepID=V5F8A5_BYSSN|nr:hypothetical protein PVAR5_0721 [Paecilomyces variotii No. 5]
MRDRCLCEQGLNSSFSTEDAILHYGGTQLKRINGPRLMRTGRTALPETGSGQGDESNTSVFTFLFGHGGEGEALSSKRFPSGQAVVSWAGGSRLEEYRVRSTNQRTSSPRTSPARRGGWGCTTAFQMLETAMEIRWNQANQRLRKKYFD